MNLSISHQDIAHAVHDFSDMEITTCAVGLRLGIKAKVFDELLKQGDVPKNVLEKLSGEKRDGPDEQQLSGR